MSLPEIFRPLTSRSDGCCLISSPNEWMPLAGSPRADLHDRLQMLQLPAHLLDLLPDVRARHRAERHQHRGARGLQDFRDLVRLQQRVDGIGDAGGLGAEQRDEGIRQQRQQEAHDIVLADAERMEHVGGLRHAADEIAIG